jgi:DNA-directed RNA polymerase specialized sigma24 family protein
MQKKIHTSSLCEFKTSLYRKDGEPVLADFRYFEKYHSEMQRTMTLFSGDSEMAGDAVQHAFVKALETPASRANA